LVDFLENMIEKVYDKRGILQYLTHENQPEKYHYDKSEVHANFDFESETRQHDILQEYDDYFAVLNGDTHPKDFLKKYSMSFTTFKK
jgi:hypothetical protein